MAVVTMSRLTDNDASLYHRGYGDGIEDAHTGAWRTGFVWGVITGFWLITIATLILAGWP